jgi:hypothetical protein
MKSKTMNKCNHKWRLLNRHSTEVSSGMDAHIKWCEICGTILECPAGPGYHSEKYRYPKNRRKKGGVMTDEISWELWINPPGFENWYEQRHGLNSLPKVIALAESLISDKSARKAKVVEIRHVVVYEAEGVG